MSLDPVCRLDVSVMDATSKTRWIFVETMTQAGQTGAGEATLIGHEGAVVHAVRQLATAVFALPDADPTRLKTPVLDGLPQAAAFAAVDQALWDITARRRGIRLAEALGELRRVRVPLYANINRRTLDRSPQGFAASARSALAAGHGAIKVAPFDEATPQIRSAGELAGAVEPGLRRIEAVREAIGPDRRLMVDCHWRLDEPAAERVITAAAGVGVHWVECPLPETDETLDALARLRRSANRQGVLLAGCEQGIGVAGFMPFLKVGAYDVMMPDAKYVGGLAEMLRLAETMRRAGVAFSPHNPSGPVCHGVSVQVCAVVAELHSLEVQFDETPLFDELVGQSSQRPEAGSIMLPTGPGIGMTLQAVPLRQHLSVRWAATRQGDGYVVISEDGHG